MLLQRLFIRSLTSCVYLGDKRVPINYRQVTNKATLAIITIYPQLR